MTPFIRNTLICILYFSFNMYGNTIDTIKTTLSVQKFLADNFKKKGFITSGKCASLSQAKQYQSYVSDFRPEKVIDSVMIEDPLTGGMVLKIIEGKTSLRDSCCIDTNDYPLNLQYSELIELTKGYTWHFYKADIDKNGYTDLIVEAGLIIIALDFETEFQAHVLGSAETFKLQKIISLKDSSTALVLLHTHTLCRYRTPSTCRKNDTIVYKFSGFAKYNSMVKPVGISKIDYYYQSSNGLVTDSYTCLEINSNGQCYLRYPAYNTVFTGTLDSEKLTRLWDQINYTDVKSKRDFYREEIDHSEGGTFAIYFDDGTVKKIDIWGHTPPLNLGYLSKGLSNISRSLEWEILDNEVHFDCPCILPELTPLSENDNYCECTW